jgi:hypothetical protein
MENPQPAHPAMLLMAEPDGTLKQELKDESWGGENWLDLDAVSLLPVWWPWGAEGERWTAQEREQAFRFYLDIALPREDVETGPQKLDTVPPLKKNLTPQDVLHSLGQLYDMVAPDSRLSLFDW